MAHMTAKKKPPRIVREWMREIGRAGGKAKSVAKANAARKNATRPRPTSRKEVA